ncbi:sulfotransferase [Novosphingobium sp. ERN07]|uniref:sulfotransferase domain-containing protein n=1 Tax=Novosphingobium sp. ERN07 TaxID=2726187 RepID=UPI001456668F|nr:sulfotransferase [Novosphingobium sp. ERN07]NLR69409.1 sulfotransferase [Novosphingobium sp. ERN07]
MSAVWTPNLIMPGVAKCGTTTLYDLLVSHPRVTGGIEKEVRFLMDAGDELATAQNVRDLGVAGWADQFADKGQGDFDVWLDASPQYQYQQVALSTIATLDPQPKVLFVVRKPSARLFSLYQYARYHHKRLPHVTSFAQFIDEIRPPVDSRLNDQKMMVNAWADSHYDQMLERWSAVVPPERLYVTSVEELGADRDGVLADIAHWLGIDPDPLLTCEVDRSNPTVKTRSRLIRMVGGRAAKLLPETPLVRRLKTFVREMNSAPLDRDEVKQNADLLAQLDAEFAPSMANFAALRAKLGLARNRSELV